MMDILIKKAVIIDSTSPFNGQQKDILISSGRISTVEDDINPALADEVIDVEGLHVSPGWFDTACRFGEPAYEEAETLESGSKAASKGGYTAVALSSHRQSAIDSRQKVEYLISRSAGLPIHIYPVGTATVGAAGKAMAETYDMAQGGAVAYGDGRQIENNLIENLVLEYNGAQGYLTITTPMDRTMMHQGVMHEGVVSTTLGLHGIPDVAEDLAVARDIFLADYSGASLHVACVTTPDALRMISEAQTRGVDVTCSITPHHLMLSDENLKEFDTRYKVMPPLRTDVHIEAMKNAIESDVVCCIASDHTPVDIEDKKCEYDRAAYGTIGLQTAFGAAWAVLKDTISLEKMVDLMSINARRRFGVAVPTVAEGSVAELTMFLPYETWTFGKEDIVSLSRNSAFLGREMCGRVVATYVKGQLHK